jgi:hypothetical protein
MKGDRYMNSKETNIFRAYLDFIDRRLKTIPEENLKFLIEKIGEICIDNLSDTVTEYYDEKNEETKKFILKLSVCIIDLARTINSFQIFLLSHNKEYHDRQWLKIRYNGDMDNIFKNSDEFKIVYDVCKEINRFKQKYHPTFTFNDICSDLTITINNILQNNDL